MRLLSSLHSDLTCGNVLTKVVCASGYRPYELSGGNGHGIGANEAAAMTMSSDVLIRTHLQASIFDGPTDMFKGACNTRALFR